MSVPFCATVKDGQRRITVVLDRPYVIYDTDRRYKKLAEALKNKSKVEEIRIILDEKYSTEDYAKSVRKSGVKLEIRDDKVFLNDKELHTSIAKRVTDFIREELPFEHLLRFIENIQENPSYTSQQELYDFLEYKDLPITEDGYFLAYKRVTSDYKDHHTNSIDNKVGAVIPRMGRSEVDDDRTVDCSKGYHAGSIKYVKGFKNGPIMIVKIHPKDVVSVPKDSSCQKVRVCFYEVVGEMKEVFDKPLYNDSLEPVTTQEGYDPNYKPDWKTIERNYSEEDKDYYEYDDDDDEDDTDDYDSDVELPTPKDVL